MKILTERAERQIRSSLELRHATRLTVTETKRGELVIAAQDCTNALVGLNYGAEHLEVQAHVR